MRTSQILIAIFFGFAFLLSNTAFAVDRTFMSTASLSSISSGSSRSLLKKTNDVKTQKSAMKLRKIRTPLVTPTVVKTVKVFCDINNYGKTNDAVRILLEAHAKRFSDIVKRNGKVTYAEPYSINKNNASNSNEYPFTGSVRIFIELYSTSAELERQITDISTEYCLGPHWNATRSGF